MVGMRGQAAAVASSGGGGGGGRWGDARHAVARSRSPPCSWCRAAERLKHKPSQGRKGPRERRTRSSTMMCSALRSPAARGMGRGLGPWAWGLGPCRGRRPACGRSKMIRRGWDRGDAGRNYCACLRAPTHVLLVYPTIHLPGRAWRLPRASQTITVPCRRAVPSTISRIPRTGPHCVLLGGGLGRTVVLAASHVHDRVHCKARTPPVFWYDD